MASLISANNLSVFIENNRMLVVPQINAVIRGTLLVYDNFYLIFIIFELTNFKYARFICFARS